MSLTDLALVLNLIIGTFNVFTVIIKIAKELKVKSCSENEIDNSYNGSGNDTDSSPKDSTFIKSYIMSIFLI